MKKPLSAALLQKMDAYWRAANYLSVAQIYLSANPLHKNPCTLQRATPARLGQTGTPCG